MLEICKKEINIALLLLFIVGVFSTFQIIQVSGITVFTILMLVSVIYFLVRDKKICIKMNNGFLWKYGILISVSEVMIFTINLKNSSEWINSSLKKYIIIILVMIFFYLVEKSYDTRVVALIKGIHTSCLIQVFWCYLQYILESLFNIDINKIFFGVSQYNLSGQKVISGLHVNAGILAPAIIFLVYYDRRWWIKVLSIIVFFISGTSTMLICGCTVLIIYGVHSMSIHYKRIISKKSFIRMLIILLVAVLGIVVLLSQKGVIDRTLSMFDSIGNRLTNVKDNEFTDGSTFVHARYYTSFLLVMSNLNLINILFGFGIGCSGVPFVQVFNQYSNIVYVPESDIMTFAYDVGIIGFVVFYLLLFTIIKKGRQIDWRYEAFMVTVLIGGIFYGIQLNWVMLFEWICLSCIKSGKSLFEIYDIG